MQWNEYRTGTYLKILGGWDDKIKREDKKLVLRTRIRQFAVIRIRILPLTSYRNCIDKYIFKK